MSCYDCGSKTQGQCDCCKLVDSDESFKPVVWCNTCQAWICKECESKWIRRGEAYFAKKFKRLQKKFRESKLAQLLKDF